MHAAHERHAIHCGEIDMTRHQGNSHDKNELFHTWQGSARGRPRPPSATLPCHMHKTLKPRLLCLLLTAACLGCPAVALAAPPQAPPAGLTRNVNPLPPGPPEQLDPYGYVVPFGQDSWVKFGGNARAMFVNDQHRVYNPGPRDSYEQYRFQVNADFHVDNLVRLYLQVGDTKTENEAPPVLPIDESDFELQQAFVGIRIPHTHGRGYVRIGRQEMQLDHGQWTTTRLIPNVLSTFDGIRMHYQTKGGTKFDAFEMKAVVPRQGSFNDSSSHQGDFYGLYVKSSWTKDFHEDFFFLGHDGPTLPIAGMPPGHEHRHGIGTRFYGKVGGFHYDTDLMYEMGTFNHSHHIRAWGIRNTYGFTFASASHPDISIRADASSGNHDGPTGSLNTFSPFYPAVGFWFGNGDFTNPLRNLIAVGPVFSMSPAHGWHFHVQALSMWRESSDDCVYIPPGLPVAGTCGGVGSNHIGINYDIGTNWVINKHFVAQFEYQYYAISGVLKDAAHGSPKYFAARLYYMF